MKARNKKGYNGNVFRQFRNGVFECVIKSIHGYIIMYINGEGIKKGLLMLSKEKGFTL